METFRLSQLRVLREMRSSRAMTTDYPRRAGVSYLLYAGATREGRSFED
jgi:hypothetical protein